MIIKKIKLSIKALKEMKNPWIYFLDYLGLKKGELVYKIKNKKIKVRAKTIDKSIFTEVALEEKYFPKKLKLGKNSVILDLGAHIGIFSVLANLKFPYAKIYSIEPAKDNFRLLSEQTKINQTNIHPFNVAISNKKGKMKLYSGRHSARQSLLRKEGDNFDVVETLSLKDFFKEQKIEKCDLLKIDIEGGEYDLFYSTPKEIFKKIKIIFLETHEIEGENPGELIEFLKKQGFEIFFKEKDFVYAFNKSK
jgi:FkbM family methyltransferase